MVCTLGSLNVKENAKVTVMFPNLVVGFQAVNHIPIGHRTYDKPICDEKSISLTFFVLKYKITHRNLAYDDDEHNLIYI